MCLFLHNVCMVVCLVHGNIYSHISSNYSLKMKRIVALYIQIISGKLNLIITKMFLLHP